MTAVDTFHETCTFCDFTSTHVEDFELHEIREDRWCFVCWTCVEALELDAGK